LLVAIVAIVVIESGDGRTTAPPNGWHNGQVSFLCDRAMIGSMQNWEYKVFASHLDPAELVFLLNESGRQGWELVTLVAVVDDLPVAVLEPDAQALDRDEVADTVAMQAFRYIFKRPLATE
jgi:hypothetical protein